MLKACVVACRCLFCELPKAEEKKVAQETYFKDIAEKYDPTIANGLTHFFKSESIVAWLADEVLDFIVNNNEEAVIQTFLTPSDLLPIDVFLAGDERRQNLKKQFLKEVADRPSLSGEPNGINLLLEFEEHASTHFSNDELDAFINAVCKTTTDYEAFIDGMDNFSPKSPKGSATIDKICDKIQKHHSNEKANEINIAGEKSDYKRLLGRLEILERDKRLDRDIHQELSALKNGNYFLPNITGDMDQLAWRYVNHIYALAEKDILPADEITGILQDQLNETSSECGKERLAWIKGRYHPKSGNSI